MRGWIISAVLLLAAVPAQAADLATLNCLLDTMPASLRKLAEQHAAASLRERSPAIDLPFEQQIAALSGGCAKRHGWSRDAAFHGEVWLRMDFMVGAVAAQARQDGFDVDTVLRVWSETPEEFRTAFMREKEHDAFNRTLIEAGVKQPPQGAFIIGMLVGYLNMRDFHRARFAAT
jgi:hypothetical protein